MDKLSRNISNILGHDVKPCHWNFPSSRYSTWIYKSFTSIYVAWNAIKIYVNYMLFEFHKVIFINISTSFQYFPSCESKFDCNIWHLPWNWNIFFSSLWPLWVFPPMPFVNLQLLVLIHDIFFGMHLVLHAMHCVPTSPH